MSGQRASYQAVFALDIITAAGALVLLGLASRPTFQRIKARRFTSWSKQDGSPLKTSLGTYLFLWPALFFLFIAYALQLVSDLLQTTGTIYYPGRHVSWNGRPSYSIGPSTYGSTISALTFITTLCIIFFTVLLNGGVWVHSSHVQSNGTGISAPKMLSKSWNTIIMLAMLATGVAAWAVAITKRDTTLGSLSSLARLSWSNILQNDRTVGIIYIVHECIVVASSLSVTIEVLREYRSTNKNGHSVSLQKLSIYMSANALKTPERNNLARFVLVVCPLIWLRDIFIIYDIVLLYMDTSTWSNSATIASTMLLIICRQLANLSILGTVLWGAWRMGRSVKLFGA